jgi:hypothetical protein
MPGSKRPRDEGGALITALLLLSACALTALSAVVLIQGGNRMLLRAERSAEDAAALVRTADKVQRLLENCAADEPDGAVGPLWEIIADMAGESGAELCLTDISSRFDLNSLRKNMIRGSQIREYLKPGVDADAFQQDREENGFGVEPERRFGEFFEEEFLLRFAARRAYWNINTADEFTLKKIFELRTLDSFAADEFHTAIREKLSARELISPVDLEAFIGTPGFQRLFPTVNAFPSINVNLAPSWVLEQLISYSAFRVLSPAAACRNIIALRKIRPLSSEDLIRLIVLEPNEEGELVPPERNRLFAWLGTVTWFWEIRIEKKGRCLTRIIARIPASPGTAPAGEREYRVVCELLPW